MHCFLWSETCQICLSGSLVQTVHFLFFQSHYYYFNVNETLQLDADSLIEIPNPNPNPYHNTNPNLYHNPNPNPFHFLDNLETKLLGD